MSGDTTPGQSRPWSDDNEGVLYSSPKFQHYWGVTVRFLMSQSGLTGGVLPLCRIVVGVFFCRRHLGQYKS